MEIWENMLENTHILFGIIITLILIVGIFPLFRLVHDQKLLKSVTPKSRGTKSERDLIIKLLKQGIPKQTIFHDLCINKGDGSFSQIDVVVPTTEGIIVFEVKDYSGWLYGNGNHSHWTKVLAFGKKKYRFYNPIKQNNSHINALRKQLKLSHDIPFFSIIAFYGNCELKEINYIPKGTFLIRPTRLSEVLKHIKDNNEAAPYTNKREIVQVLQEAVITGDNFNYQKKHIENINDMIGKHRIFD